MSEHRPRHTILKLLRAIIRAWPEMTPALPSPEPGAYVVGVPSSKPPVPAAVISVRRDACEILAAWRLLVIEDQDLTKTHVDGSDAVGMCRFLARWADYLECDDTVDDVIRELEHIARQCEDIANGVRRRRFKVGSPCLGVDELDEERPCPGELIARFGDVTSLTPQYFPLPPDA